MSQTLELTAVKMSGGVGSALVEMIKGSDEGDE